MRAVTIIAALSVVAVATPAFSDQLFDNYFKLATEREGPVGQTACGHFQKFVREWVRGKIPGVTGLSVRGVAEDSPDAGSEEGPINCVAESNGNPYWY
jgi:hypothetical protein